MSSWQARAAAHAARWRVRSALGDMSDIGRVRAVFGSPLPAPAGVKYTPASLGGIAGEWVEGAGNDAAGRSVANRVEPPLLFYIHGGGFVGGSPLTHRPVTAALALRGLRVFVPDYRLAPEHPYPAALDDVRAAWRALRDQHVDAPITVGGDSAGGNLALALMLSLDRDGETLPAAAVLFSPSTDLSGQSASLLANTGRDPMFSGPSLEHLARAYLGPLGQANDPLVSPIFGDLAHLPPLLLHVGADEVLRDDGLRLAEKARRAGVRVELVVWAAVPHGWQLLQGLPEARRSLDAAARFLKEAVRRSDPSHVEFVNTVIIGAGLSGIGTAAHLQEHCPGHHFTILEARAALGGTWDLFRYPGVRSDSDMHTLGYGFKPWTNDRTIADGSAILDYVRETAVERGIDQQIRYQHRVVAAAWSSDDARWLLTIERGEGREPVQIACRFLLFCSGYYRYDAGHAPEFAGRAEFRGAVVHPQAWPATMDLADRRVVVIGSGATAVTLVPALAQRGAQVVLLQRSPGYLLALPSRDGLARALKRVLPATVAARLVRAKNIALGLILFKLSRRFPSRMRGFLTNGVKRALPGQDIERHFAPRYNPWEQRLCIVPDGDLFDAVRQARAEIVTDTIDRFTAAGIRLASGREIAADIIVTATGLEVSVLGDIAVSVDGRPIDFAQTLAYKAMMFSGVPNLVSTFGYTNASWTLKADLTAAYTCRLLDFMDRRGYVAVTPRHDPAMPTRPFIDFSSGYIQRALHRMPRQGEHAPWRLHQNYLRDFIALRFGRLDDGTLDFTRLATAPDQSPTASSIRTSSNSVPPGTRRNDTTR